MKLANVVAEVNKNEGAKPNTTEIATALPIAIRLLIVGIITETESWPGSVKNIMIITRI